MRRYKWMVCVLLAAAAILGCAFLPVLTAAVQDGITMEKVSYLDMDPVKLEFHDPESEANRLSVLGKLALCVNPAQVEVSENETRMTYDEAFSCVQEAMRPYIDAGMLPEEYLNSRISVTPMLTYDRNNGGNYAIIWNVILSQKKAAYEPYYYLGISLDDETGKLLQIMFSYGEPMYDSEALEKLMDTFTAIYFSQLELVPTEAIAIATPASDDAVGLLYTFGDTEYGQIDITFYMNTQEFNCTFYYDAVSTRESEE